MRKDSEQVQPEDQPKAGSVDGAKQPPWRRPVVTRLSFEQTLSAAGSNTDGHTGSL
jgi:hypothetical protein